MPSQTSKNVLDMSSTANQTSTESRDCVSKVSDCEMLMCQSADSELVDNVFSSSNDNEPTEMIDLSANQVEITISSSNSSLSQKIKQKPTCNFVHRGIQCHLKNIVKQKRYRYAYLCQQSLLLYSVPWLNYLN